MRVDQLFSLDTNIFQPIKNWLQIYHYYIVENGFKHS